VLYKPFEVVKNSREFQITTIESCERDLLVTIVTSLFSIKISPPRVRRHIVEPCKIMCFFGRVVI